MRAAPLILGASLCLSPLGGCQMTMIPELTLAVSPEEPAPSVARELGDFLSSRRFAIEIQASSSPTDIVAAIRDRRVDLALVEEPAGPTTGVVTVAPLYPSVLHVLHRDPEDPPDFAALIRGKSVYPGPAGGAANRLLGQLTKDFAVKPEEYRVLENPWTEQPDVYFVFGGLLTEDSIRQLGGYRLFSFGQPDELDRGSVADGIVLKHPNLRSFVLPESVYYALSRPAVVTLAIRTVLISHADFDPELAQTIATELFENAQELASSYPLVTQELNVDLDPATLTFPLHRGARRYLERDKPSFIERYVEIIALLLTLFLALLSGAVWLYRYRQQERKDRVDLYYDRLLAIRGELTAEGQANASREALRQRALDIQQEVLGLVMDERIAADTSLVVFLNLSNQIINELDRSLVAHD